MSEHALTFHNDGFLLSVTVQFPATVETWYDREVWNNVVVAVMDAVRKPVITTDEDEAA